MPLTPKENLLAALHHADPEWVPYAGDGSWCLVDCAGRRPPVTGVDEWGVTWEPLPGTYVAGGGEPAASYAAAPAAESAAALLDRPFPAGGDPADYACLLDGCDPEQELIIGQHPAGLLDRFESLLGMETALVALLAEREAAAEVMGRIADHHVQVARGYLAAGAQAGWLADDYAGQEGPYLRPALWRELILPGLARIIAVYREAGAPVFFHTCGQADAFLGDLVDLGVTAFNLETAACDLAALKTRYGRRIGFFGGVSAGLMQQVAPEMVYAAAARAIRELGPGGGLVLAPDQPLHMPAANQAALQAAARDHGRYPLHG